MGNTLAILIRQNTSDDSILVDDPDSAMNPPPNDLLMPFSDFMEFSETYKLLNDGFRHRAGRLLQPSLHRIGNSLRNAIFVQSTHANQIQFLLHTGFLPTHAPL